MFVTKFYEINKSVLIFQYMHDTGSIGDILFSMSIVEYQYLR